MIFLSQMKRYHLTRMVINLMNFNLEILLRINLLPHLLFVKSNSKAVIQNIKNKKQEELVALLQIDFLFLINIEKTYTFANYYETISFVNAVAWVSNQEGHHPNLEVNFRDAKVKYWTHAIGGMSENDFICAAKVDAL